MMARLSSVVLTTLFAVLLSSSSSSSSTVLVAAVSETAPAQVPKDAGTASAPAPACASGRGGSTEGSPEELCVKQNKQKIDDDMSALKARLAKLTEGMGGDVHKLIVDHEEEQKLYKSIVDKDIKDEKAASEKFNLKEKQITYDGKEKEVIERRKALLAVKTRHDFKDGEIIDASKLFPKTDNTGKTKYINANDINIEEYYKTHMGIDINADDEYQINKEPKLNSNLQEAAILSSNDEDDIVYSPDESDWNNFFDTGETNLLLDSLGCVLANHTHGMLWNHYRSDGKLISTNRKERDRYGDLPYSTEPIQDNSKTKFNTWSYLNKKYYETIGNRQNNMTKFQRDEIQNEIGIVNNESSEQEKQMSESGIQIPYSISYNLIAGRSVSTETFIAKDTLIWTSTNSLVTFDPPTDYRTFIESILEDNTLSAKKANNLACDIAMWGYRGLKRDGLIEEINNDISVANEDGTKTIHKRRVMVHDVVNCLRLDDSSLFNHADPEEQSAKLNMEFRQIFDEKTGNKPIRSNNFNCGYGYGLYARRDIYKGEELRYNYDFNVQETPDDATEIEALTKALQKELEKEEKTKAVEKPKEYKKFVRFIPNPDKGSDEPWIIGSDEWDAWYENPFRQQSDLLDDINFNGMGTCPNANDTHGIIDNYDDEQMEESNGMQFYSKIPTPADTWEPLRTNYLAVTSTNIPEYKEARKVFSNNIDEPLTTGFEVPIEIKYNEKLGRSVYATEFIKEGTYVYNPKNIAEFHPPTDFRKFIDRMKDPELNNNNRHIQSLACDSIIWSSMEITNRYDKKDKMVCLSFDEGSLLNNGFTNYTANNLIKHTIMENDNGKKTIDEERFTCRDRGFYAKRDIQAGEELRYAYNPKDDEPELYKPTIDDWRTFLITGGEDELQDSKKKQPILDSIHCYDESDPEFIYGKDDWNDLFDYYVSTFKSSETKSTIQEEYDVTDTYSTSAFKGYPIVNHDNNNGMAFIQNMYEVRFDTNNHRRAIYATEDIPSGTQIWQPSTTVQFYPMVQYYRFLEQILVAGDNAMACDIVDWTYNTNDGKMLCIAFDDMSMMNGIDIDFSMSGNDNNSIEQTIMMSKVNIGWKPTKKEYNLYAYDFGCQDGGSLFATRDIKKGEELSYWRRKPSPEPLGVNSAATSTE